MAKTTKTIESAAAPEPEPRSPYYETKTSWDAGAGEEDQPQPAGDVAVDHGPVQGQVQQQVSMQPEGGRNFAMIPGLGMVAVAGRPGARHPSEDRPVGGGPHGHDFQTSPDDGPPDAATDQVAAASRPVFPPGATN